MYFFFINILFLNKAIGISEDNEKAKVAIEMFTTIIAQFVAKYAVSLNGIDAMVFTGGIGENQINIRKKICNYLKFMGLEIDEQTNNVRGEEILITKPESKIKAYIIPTNEELVIARDTKELVENIKILQKKYVRTQDEKVKEELDAKQARLDSIPLYDSYQKKLAEVNRKIDFIKDELNDYFYKVVNHEK